MAAREFQHLVRRMRHWQREFFKSRGRTALQQAKDLERRVDEVLVHYGLEPEPTLYDQIPEQKTKESHS